MILFTPTEVRYFHILFALSISHNYMLILPIFHFTLFSEVNAVLKLQVPLGIEKEADDIHEPHHFAY